MCVTLIGGMDRLQPQYRVEAEKEGHELKCISHNEQNFINKLGNPDIIIIFTNKISHEARNKAIRHAKKREIPVHLCHSCGLSTLRNIFKAD